MQVQLLINNDRDGVKGNACALLLFYAAVKLKTIDITDNSIVKVYPGFSNGIETPSITGTKSKSDILVLGFSIVAL